VEDATVNIPADDLVKSIQLQIKLTGMWKFKLRLWLSIQIIKIAAKVGGFKGVEVNTDGN